MAPLTLGYWNYRGFGAPILYLLHHVGAEFELKLYPIGEARPGPFKDAWRNVRDQVGLDFPNLPYLIDGDVKINQTVAIMRRLGRKFNLAGKNEDEVTQLDMVEQQIRDLQTGLGDLVYSPFYEHLKDGYLQELPYKLELLSKYLGERDWFVGDSVTYVDFLAYEALDHNRYFASDIFAKFPSLESFLKRVQSLPNIRKYMNSDKYHKWPLFSLVASFGGKGEPPV